MSAVIALIGPSGSGKSTLGKALAERLGWTFLDSDREIERREGCSIADIFRDSGEAEFRRLERRLLDELKESRSKELVLATGGGLPVVADNWRELDSFACTVFLTAPLEVLVTRINRGENRPLLSPGASASEAFEADAVKQRLGKLIAERESIYNRARYKIDTSAKPFEQLIEELLELVASVKRPTT
ncbi:MAG: shikimate kinase [Candidatus Obscuribacterales bacterium]|nr:shikimate kinase [Candidatus Obscuribacterales bacterium]